MIIGIQPDHMNQESYSDRWGQSLRNRGVEVRSLNLLAHDALEQASACDGIMWRWIHSPQDKQQAQHILYLIEHHMGIPVFPDSKTSWHYDSKLSQYYLLNTLQVPMPETWIFWNLDDAAKWAETAHYPIVFKLSCGASSSNVLKVDSQTKALKLIKRMFGAGMFPSTMTHYASDQEWLRRIKGWFSRIHPSLRFLTIGDYPPLPSFWWRPEKDYAYFQELLPDNSFDTRVTIIGNRAFGFRRLNRPKDFRASGSGRILYEPSVVDPECVKLAFEVSRRGQFQSMAYDFLYKDRKPTICEISYTFVDWAVHNCPGHWDPSLQWIDGQMWPEDAQVEDFLALVMEKRS